MSLSKYERENTIKASVSVKDSDSNYTDPSGNKIFLRVKDSEGNYIIGNTSSGATASRVGTGQYDYYFNTDSTNPLGIYILEWYGYHDLGTIDGIYYGFKKFTQRDAVNIVDTEH
jgi:hypothetical protein